MDEEVDTCTPSRSWLEVDPVSCCIIPIPIDRRCREGLTSGWLKSLGPKSEGSELAAEATRPKREKVLPSLAPSVFVVDSRSFFPHFASGASVPAI